MKAWHRFIGWMVFAAGVGGACAQMPVLGSIEAPYPNLQGTVIIASTQWGPGTVAYGSVGTPLVLNGSDLGASGIVQFIAYKNGSVDPNVTPVQASVSMWSPTMLILSVPSNAYSGLVKVTTGEGKTSNPLPFMVTPGTYAGTCPIRPASNQLQITTSSLSDGTVGQSYSVTLGATGGTAAYSWSITSGTLPSGLSLNASTGVISGTPSSASGPVDVTFQVTDSSSPSQHDEAVLSLTVESSTLTASTVYNYTATYDAVGNVAQSTDTVMGTWTMTPSGGPSGYDSLNRLVSANITWPDSTQQIACFTYDAFGNRTMQALSATACNANPTPTAWAQFNGTTNGTNNNQMSATSQNPLQGATGGYDLSGDITNDGINQYVYDAEGRICAVLNTAVPGNPIMTGYLYDADGTRVAKGSITTLSCDPTTSGFQFTENYVLGPGGEELTMMSGSNAWQRTNVYAGGKLLATYDTAGLHFHLEDALGTRRMQLSGELADLGQPETDIQSLPFGDQLNSFPDQYAPSTADDATPLHFTGKERDAESGNDYFDARYYSSAMGRFMSPDWSAKEEPVPYAKMDDPQSLNLYAYVENNPLIHVDSDGHCCDLEDVGNFIGGAVNAYLSDNVLGAGRQEQGTASGQVGAFVGDAVATLQGAQEIVTGGGAALGGGIEAGVTSPAAATGAGALVPAAGAAVAAGGALVAAHGATVATEGLTHMAMGLGSYTNTHASGKTYSGKGDQARSQASGKRVEKATGDKHVATDHTSSSSDRESFKDESRRIDANGGVGSSRNHNQAESPGKKYRQQDGSN